MAFAPDGGTLYSASTDRTLLAWDLSGERPFIPRIAEVEPERSLLAVAAPDGDAVVYLAGEGGATWVARCSSSMSARAD